MAVPAQQESVYSRTDPYCHSKWWVHAVNATKPFQRQ